MLKIVNKQGDCKSNVLKVNIPRNDLPKNSGAFGADSFWVWGLVRNDEGDGGEDIVMGDLVLTQNEVNPVMTALLDHGLEVTALHNHFFWDEPRVFFMHIHGHGKAVDLANQRKPALSFRHCRVRQTVEGIFFEYCYPGDALAFTSEREGISLADQDNFVHQQSGDGSERDPGGQHVASEEIEDHSRPAGVNRDQSSADVKRSDCRREVCTLDMPKAEELT